MHKNEVVVIGGGLTGLCAAIAALEEGATVRLLTRGAGSLAIGGGTIDLLGWDVAGNQVVDPWPAFARLGKEHPYAKLGKDAVQQALQQFCRWTDEADFPYTAGDKNQWLPTPAGTWKPTWLIPPTMSRDLRSAEQILILGFRGLKDHSSMLVRQGLQRRWPNKAVRLVEIGEHLPPGRDLSTLDLARWLDSEDGQQQLLQQLPAALPGEMVLCPPILGSSAARIVWQRMEGESGRPWLEMVGFPPAVTGLRLRDLLLRRFRRLGGRLVENALVQDDERSEDCCLAVKSGDGRPVRWPADSFVLASGGFFGGGLRADRQGVEECVFSLPVQGQPGSSGWTAADLFDPLGQPYAHCGISVNSLLQPIDGSGKIILQNLFIAGRGLAGYDPAAELSGNGVAVATGICAGRRAGEVRQ